MRDIVHTPLKTKLVETLRSILETIGQVHIHTYNSLRYVFERRVNQREFWAHCYESTWNSIGTVIITTASIGAVSALQLTSYFASFGVLSEIGGTNAVVQFRELSPVITAVVLIGRVGSAWAAEIGTMKISEQLSALKVMRISHEWFLVAPRVLGAMVAMPILNMVAIISSMAGGYLIAAAIANVGALPYIYSVKHFVELKDIIVTTIKSISFGAMLASVSCSCGMSAEGGASGVGKFTTKAVVTSLIFLFAMNYLLSYIFYSLLK